MIDDLSRQLDKELSGFNEIVRGSTEIFWYKEMKEIQQVTIEIRKAIKKEKHHIDLHLLQTRINQTKQSAEDLMNFLNFRVWSINTLRRDVQSAYLSAVNKVWEITSQADVSYSRISRKLIELQNIQKWAAYNINELSKPLKRTTNTRDEVLCAEKELNAYVIRMAKRDMKATRVFEGKRVFTEALHAMKDVYLTK
jgi:hypothetical protein